ncbi:MAG: hypothetical protein ACLRRA_07930 [Acutalibacteraceae bacterium]
MDFLTNAWDTFLGLIKSFQVTDALDIILVSFILTMPLNWFVKLVPNS